MQSEKATATRTNLNHLTEINIHNREETKTN